jgi:hypothetical protein
LYFILFSIPYTAAFLVEEKYTFTLSYFSTGWLYYIMCGMHRALNFAPGELAVKNTCYFLVKNL